MRTVFAICLRDLKALFATPKAAVVTCIFLVLMSIFFRSFLFTYVEMQRTAAGYGGESATLEQILRALFFNLHFVLILIVPGITMSTYAEEKRLQTFKLLQTAPMHPWQIVLGKFLASAGLMSFILLSTTIYPLYLLAFGNPDPGPIASGYLGLFLLTLFMVAYGNWISSMTSNQFVAFALTILGVFVLLILNWVAPNISGGGYGEAILKYVATTPHLDNFLKGMITVSDVVYFLCATVLFLFFTTIVIDSERWR